MGTFAFLACPGQVVSFEFWRFGTGSSNQS
jgi:hypothetical protein